MPEPATPHLGTCPEDVYTMGCQSSIKNKEKDLQMSTYMLRWRRHIMWKILSSSVCAGTQGQSIPPKQLGRTPPEWTSVAVPGVGFQDDLPLPCCTSAFPLATNIYYFNNLKTCIHGLKTVFPQLSSSEATNKGITLLFYKYSQAPHSGPPALQRAWHRSSWCGISNLCVFFFLLFASQTPWARLTQAQAFPWAVSLLAHSRCLSSNASSPFGTWHRCFLLSPGSGFSVPKLPEVPWNTPQG